MRADPSLPLTLRALVALAGNFEVSRLNDYEVAQAAHSLLVSSARVRNLSDIETAIAFFARSPIGNRNILLGLFERAPDLLDFGASPDTGILFASQYAAYGGATAAGGAPMDDQIRQGGETDGTIGATRGGRWLCRWDLRFLVGDEAADAIWGQASERFIRGLAGAVKVLLGSAEFDRMLRSPGNHPLFTVSGITRILYGLEEGAARIRHPDPALLTGGVVKQVQGKTLIFRAGE